MCDRRKVSLEAYLELFEIIGARLKALKLDGSAMRTSTNSRLKNDRGLRAIVACCPYLERLDLSCCLLTTAKVNMLLGLLCGELGDRLLTLNLNNTNTQLNLNNTNTQLDHFIPEIATILSNCTRVPVLRELRIVTRTPLWVSSFDALYNALQVNKTLEILELTKSRLDGCCHGSENIPLFPSACRAPVDRVDSEL